MKKNLIVLQEECSDCGICSLASIIKYYGGNFSLEKLRFYTNTNSNGTNAYELIECAKKIGFNAYGEKCTKLNEINQPLIAHLKLDNDLYHFVVVYEIKKDLITIMDPSRGFYKMKLNEFYKIYTGVILKFFPISTIPKYKETNFIQSKLKKEIIANKKNYILIFIISILILLFTMINNFNIKILNNNSKTFILLFIIILINELLIYIKNILLLNSSIKFNNKIIKEFTIHIFKLPLYYLKLKQKGVISTRYNELNDLTNNILNIIIEIIFYILLSILTIVLLMYYSLKISTLILFITLIYFIFNIKIYSKLLNEIKYLINLEENYNSNILDFISNFNTIKHLNIYKYFINNLDTNLTNKNNINKKLNNKILSITLINNILTGILLLTVLYLLINLNYDISNCLVIYILFNFYINNIKGLINYYPTIMLFKTIVNKSNDFLSFVEKNNLENIYNFKTITLNKLSYKINNRLVLNNINYKIYIRDKIFIKGPSGIGKSTLMKILNNEIIRYKGNILIDDKDIRNYKLDNLITYVSQNETLFNDTIYNNLLLGKVINEEEIKKILKICRLDNINIIKNEGLNSFIINDNSLSGGEKNRLILARSLIHSKEILILDEVLKEVDESLEKDIIKNILKYYKEKTIIYISHKKVDYLFNKVLTFRKEYNDVRK